MAGFRRLTLLAVASVAVVPVMWVAEEALIMAATWAVVETWVAAAIWVVAVTSVAVATSAAEVAVTLVVAVVPQVRREARATSESNL